MFRSGIPSSETSPSQEKEGDLTRLLQDTSPKIIIKEQNKLYLMKFIRKTTLR